VSGRTIGEELRARARAEPDRQALVSREERLTYSEFDRRVTDAAADLVRAGVERGDRVALLLPNGTDLACSIYATLRAGAAIVPLNPSIKPARLARVLADSGVKVVVTDSNLAAHVDAALGDGGMVKILEDLGADPSRGAGDEEAGSPGPISADLAAVVYTSGSTGEPKGVAVSHGTMSFVRDSISSYLEMTPHDRVLCVLPLSFGYGLYQLLTCVSTGATLVLEPGAAFAGTVLDVLADEEITALPAVPTIFQLLLSGGLADRELPHLRTLTNAGAGLPTAAVKKLRTALPEARLFLMYGQTEAQRICYLPPEFVDEKPSSVGVPIPGTEVWIAAPDGQQLGPGETGELIVRGAHVMHGYWGRPEASEAKLRPGRWPWERVLATGDLFRLDEDGFLYFHSRTDDIIKSRGEKVAPREVEEALCDADGVREAAVVGVPDDLLGEAIHAHVVAEPGHELDPRALRRFCSERLEGHMVPKTVLIHAELPRTGNNKIDRRLLAEGSG
jgi:amino acid adenylation domain-containing protein